MIKGKAEKKNQLLKPAGYQTLDSRNKTKSWVTGILKTSEVNSEKGTNLLGNEIIVYGSDIK